LTRRSSAKADVEITSLEELYVPHAVAGFT
jgi:hypothetical protein